MLILGIDPGLNACGCALLEASTGYLQRAWVARSIAGPGDEPLRRIVRMADAVWDSMGDTFDVRSLGSLICEWPEVYAPRRGRKRVDPNVSLVPLAGVVAAVAYGAPVGLPVHRVFPKEWKGTQDGDAFTRVIERRLSTLELATFDPQCPASLRHNAVDAAGLCLWQVGRLVHRRFNSRGAPASKAFT